MSMPISSRFIILFAVAPLALAGCNDALSPSPAIDVALGISDRQGPFPVTFEGTGPGLLCDVTYEARGLGQGAHAIWGDGSVLFYTVPNRGVPYYRIDISANDVRSTFAADTIGPGQVEHTRWLFATPAVLEIAVNFSYQVDPGGEVKTATSRFTCGGDRPPVATRDSGPTVRASRVEPRAVALIER